MESAEVGGWVVLEYGSLFPEAYVPHFLKTSAIEKVYSNVCHGSLFNQVKNGRNDTIKEGAIMSYHRIVKSGLSFLLISVYVALSWKLAFAQWGGYRDWHMGQQGMMGGWGFGGWFWSIFMLLFWVLVIIGLIFLIRWLVQTTRKGTGTSDGGSRALDILKERYARGEINKEEFEEKKRDLM